MIFSDLSAEYPSAKVIAIGATETARQVVEYDAEMNNRIAELQVPLMTDDELRQIVDHGQHLLNIDLSSLRSSFVQYSMGVPSICHQLALNACLEREIMQTVTDRVIFAAADLEPAVKRWVLESSDTLKATFDRALRRHKVKKYDNTRLILSVLAGGPISGMLHSEILKGVRQTAPNYPAGNLTMYLQQLMGDARGSILRLSMDGRYRFVDPLHHTYAKASLLEGQAGDVMVDPDLLAEVARKILADALEMTRWPTRPPHDH
jgi:hypothetical protein